MLGGVTSYPLPTPYWVWPYSAGGDWQNMADSVEKVDRGFHGRKVRASD
jgi:hypothetical protein